MKGTLFEHCIIEFLYTYSADESDESHTTLPETCMKGHSSTQILSSHRNAFSTCNDHKTTSTL